MSETLTFVEYTKKFKSFLFDKIDVLNNITLDREKFEFGQVEFGNFSTDEQTYDTKIMLSGKPGSGYLGTTAIYGLRVNLDKEINFKQTKDIITNVTTTHELIPFLNSACNGLELTEFDIEDNFIDVTWNQETARQVKIKASDTSYYFSGEANVTLGIRSSSPDWEENISTNHYFTITYTKDFNSYKTAIQKYNHNKKLCYFDLLSNVKNVNNFSLTKVRETQTNNIVLTGNFSFLMDEKDCQTGLLVTKYYEATDIVIDDKGKLLYFFTNKYSESLIQGFYYQSDWLYRIDYTKTKIIRTDKLHFTDTQFFIDIPTDKIIVNIHLTENNELMVVFLTKNGNTILVKRYTSDGVDKNLDTVITNPDNLTYYGYQKSIITPIGELVIELKSNSGYESYLKPPVVNGKDLFTQTTNSEPFKTFNPYLVFTPEGELNITHKMFFDIKPVIFIRETDEPINNLLNYFNGEIISLRLMQNILDRGSYYERFCFDNIGFTELTHLSILNSPYIKTPEVKLKQIFKTKRSTTTNSFYIYGLYTENGVDKKGLIVSHKEDAKSKVCFTVFKEFGETTTDFIINEE